MAQKEKLEEAKRLYQTANADQRYVLESLFPELKESKDERIRKELIEFVKSRGGFKQEYIAWLEKQGKHSIYNVPSREVILAIWDLGNEWKELTNGSISTEYGTQLDYIQKHWHESEYYLREKQGEQKPADKVEPKFKVGDWITNGACTIQITSVGGKYYWHDNDCVGGDIESIDKEYHLWTIKDAKDGDVLATEDNCMCIFDNTVEEGKYPFAYCGLSMYGFKVYDRTLPFTHDNVYPATKEQRDLLFQKIKEAGYEWDAEKKELRKIDARKNLTLDGDLMQADCMIVEQNPTWTEEDEKEYKYALKFVDNILNNCGNKKDYEHSKRCYDWIKSLKQRIAP